MLNSFSLWLCWCCRQPCVDEKGVLHSRPYVCRGLVRQRVLECPRPVCVQNMHGGRGSFCNRLTACNIIKRCRATTALTNTHDPLRHAPSSPFTTSTACALASAMRRGVRQSRSRTHTTAASLGVAARMARTAAGGARMSSAM